VKGHVQLLRFPPSVSLDLEEPSRSPTPATDIVVKYDGLAERSWIHSLGGGAIESLHKVND
jgi:hypothetical protein